MGYFLPGHLQKYPQFWNSTWWNFNKTCSLSSGNLFHVFFKSDFHNRKLFLQSKYLCKKNEMIYAKKMQWTALVEFDKMPAGKALEQKNSTFVIVIQRQIVAKKRAMHFSVNNVSVPALHAPLALISEEKKLAVRSTHVWYTLFKNPASC